MQNLICEGCEKKFNKKIRNPRKLDCGCIICERCLKSTLKLSKKLECALHNIVTNKNIEDLEKIEFQELEGVQNEENLEKETELLTQQEDLKQTSTWFLFKAASNAFNQNQCTCHDQIFQYFCSCEDIQICSQCTLSDQHKDHKFVLIEEKIKELKDQIQLKFHGLQDSMSLESKIEELKSYTQNLYDKQILQCNAIFNNLSSIYTQLLSLYYKLIDTKQRKIQDLAKKIQSTIGNLQEIKHNFLVLQDIKEDSIEQCQEKIQKLNLIDRKFKEQQLIEIKRKEYSLQQIEQKLQIRIIKELYEQSQNSLNQDSIQQSQTQQQNSIQEVAQQQQTPIQQFEGLQDTYLMSANWMNYLQFMNYGNYGQNIGQEYQSLTGEKSHQTYENQLQQESKAQEYPPAPLQDLIKQRTSNQPKNFTFYLRIRNESNSRQAFDLNTNKISSIKINSLEEINCPYTYCIQIDDKQVILAGGENANSYMNNLIIINETQIQARKLNFPKRQPSLAYDSQEKVYITAGCDTSWNYANTCEVFSLKTQTSTIIENHPYRMYQHGICYAYEVAITLGGYFNSKPIANVCYYDTQSNK